MLGHSNVLTVVMEIDIGKVCPPEHGWCSMKLACDRCTTIVIKRCRNEQEARAAAPDNYQGKTALGHTLVVAAGVRMRALRCVVRVVCIQTLPVFSARISARILHALCTNSALTCVPRNCSPLVFAQSSLCVQALFDARMFPPSARRCQTRSKLRASFVPHFGPQRVNSVHPMLSSSEKQ